MAFVLFPLTAASFDSGWFSLSSQAGAASGKDVAHGLGAVPSTVKVSVKAVDGANVDYVFNGWGVPQSSSGVNRVYGGLVYAYNENTVRLWAPNDDGGARASSAPARAATGRTTSTSRGRRGAACSPTSARTASAPPRRW